MNSLPEGPMIVNMPALYGLLADKPGVPFSTWIVIWVLVILKQLCRAFLLYLTLRFATASVCEDVIVHVRKKQCGDIRDVPLLPHDMSHKIGLTEDFIE